MKLNFHTCSYQFIENDYNSDFRFKGMPVSSIQLLDPEHVVHIGTFSETMYPSLRLCYVVMPKELVSDFDTYFKSLHHETSSISQLAMMNFINSSDYDKHLLKMNKVYRNKRKFLIDCLQLLFREEIAISGDAAGLYLVVEFKNYWFTGNKLEKLQEKGVCMYSLYDFSPVQPEKTNKLLLGYGNIQNDEIKKGLEILHDMISQTL